MFTSEKLITVQFYDLDPMNVVWHGNYVKYLEEARCDMLNKLGYTYEEMRKDGFAYPVATMEMKYIKPCVFNQVIKVVSTVVEIEPCLIIKYTIFLVHSEHFHNYNIVVNNHFQDSYVDNFPSSKLCHPIHFFHHHYQWKSTNDYCLDRFSLVCLDLKWGIFEEMKIFLLISN